MGRRLFFENIVQLKQTLVCLDRQIKSCTSSNFMAMVGLPLRRFSSSTALAVNTNTQLPLNFDNMSMRPQKIVVGANHQKRLPSGIARCILAAYQLIRFSGRTGTYGSFPLGVCRLLTENVISSWLSLSLKLAIEPARLCSRALPCRCPWNTISNVSVLTLVFEVFFGCCSSEKPVIVPSIEICVHHVLLHLSARFV